jgi:hypothetical protein
MVIMKNILHGQEHLSRVPQLMEKLWHLQDKQIHYMIHFFFADGNCEIVMPAEMDKDQIAAFIQDYCTKRKPSAVVQVTEAWKTKLPDNTDLDRYQKDDGYQSFIKSQVVRQEILLVLTETRLGIINYEWEIQRDGDDVKLSPMVQHEDNIKQGRLAHFLLSLDDE